MAVLIATLPSVLTATQWLFVLIATLPNVLTATQLMFVLIATLPLFALPDLLRPVCNEKLHKYACWCRRI